MVSDQIGPEPLTPQGGASDPQEPSAADDTGPIDVHELLESTRKLFDQDEVTQALERVGLADLTATETEPVEGGDQFPAKATEQHPPESTVEPSAIDTTTEPTESDDPSEELPARRGVNILAIVSLLLALVLSPLALIFGYIALGQTRRANQRGEALALWGIGLGWLVFAAWAIGLGALWWIAAEEGITFDALGELIDFLRIP